MEFQACQVEKGRQVSPVCRDYPAARVSVEWTDCLEWKDLSAMLASQVNQDFQDNQVSREWLDCLEDQA